MLKRLIPVAALALLCAGAGSIADEGLADCADQFPGGVLANAPTTEATEADEPEDNNVHVCERSGDVSFFAFEYDPGKLAPLWVAYRIADTFGPGGCASMSRHDMRCHFRKEDVEACIADNENVSDPFHVDPLLAANHVARLSTGAFSGTGHDRGHMAPNNAFSWHACGAYKTFTMANMAAQWGSLNQQLWGDVETQVLYWGVKDGPVHVVTGPIWSAFPAERFEAVTDGVVDTSTIPPPGEKLKRLDGTALPNTIPRPTGFFEVIFRAGDDTAPDRVIAFLAPHTKETGLSFWLFVSTVSLVEEASGLRFGFADELKGWPDLSYWRAEARRVPSDWSSPRQDCTAMLPVAGWMAERPQAERVALCRSSDPAP